MDKVSKSHKEPSNLDKAVIALAASAFAAFLGIILVSIIDWWEWKEAGPAYETSLITNILGTTFIVGIFMVIVAIIAITLYSILLKKLFAKDSEKKDKSFSILIGAAKGHEQQIIDLMISVIQPIPGKDTITTAKAAKFIKALKAMNLMDVNLEGQHLIPWIEMVTGFAAGKTSPFNQALKAVKVDDDDVPKYKAQLEQILAS